jgi:SAM-dependent methyltransferase
MPVSLASRFEKAARKVVPSTSMLSYNPVFKVVGNAISSAYSMLHPMTRNLPPNHLRVRIGVGNELLFSQPRYLMGGQNFWTGLFARGWINFESNIVDIGVGCGRYAHILRDLNFYGQRYTGTYTGIDIDEELLGWCEKNFDSERFRFLLSGHQSSSYKGTGGVEGGGTEQIADGTQDLVFSTSLYTHLLTEELDYYTRESARMLKPGGHMMMSYFSLTTPPPTYGGRHTFRHQRGIAWIESEKQPTAAVAYHDGDLRELVLAAGFSQVEFTSDRKHWQQMIIATR